MHLLSLRKGKPFEILNCPQLNKDSIVSELFGHEKGSYTGAERKRPGIATAAVGGTLFLDEIEALDLDCQGTILRFIDEKEIKPLGSDKAVVLDIRFIVATNRDLGAMVKAGEFREDLLSRLSGAVITIPPLRDREAEEIERLARYFYRAFRKENGDKKGYSDVRVSDSVWRELAGLQHSWPGNVRELQQLIETTLLEHSSKTVGIDAFIQALKRTANGIIAPLTSQMPVQPDGNLTDREQTVLGLIRSKGRVSRGDVEATLGVKSTVAWAILKTMAEKGLITKGGVGRAVFYLLGDNA